MQGGGRNGGRAGYWSVGEAWQSLAVPACRGDGGIRDDGDGTGLGHLAGQGDGAAVRDGLASEVGALDVGVHRVTVPGALELPGGAGALTIDDAQGQSVVALTDTDVERGAGVGVVEAELTGGRIPDSPYAGAANRGLGRSCLQLQDGLTGVAAVTDEVFDGAASGGDDRGTEWLGSGVEHVVFADGEIGGHHESVTAVQTEGRGGVLRDTVPLPGRGLLAGGVRR